MNMKREKQKSLFASGLYIVLALCVLTVVGAGAYTAISSLFSAPKTVGTTTFPQESKPITDATTEKPFEHSVSGGFGVIAAPDGGPEQSNPDLATESEAVSHVYLSPVEETSVQKAYQIDSLSYSETMADWRAHTGVDFTAEVGCAVCAFSDGVVESVHADPLMGQTVVINHGDGLKSVYQNLSEELPDAITVGASVAAGDLIGKVGETALIECAETSHLHFELQKDGAAIDPGNYLDL